MNDGWLKRSALLRMIIVGALSLALLIPSFMVMGLISDRESRRNDVIAEVNEKWGQEQTIAGPMLSVPIKKYVEQQKGELRELSGRVTILPESLSITASAAPEVRARGIYSSVLYSSKLELKGSFTLSELDLSGVKPEHVQWNEARLVIGISDLKGIRETIVVQWNGKSHTAGPGITGSDVVSSGITISPDIVAGTHAYKFSTSISLDGSGYLQFVPVGKETIVRASSNWQSPSFVGRFLPDTRAVSADGFSAEWRILHLNRNFPQQWIDYESQLRTEDPLRPTTISENLANFAFGVKLLQPVDEYQKTMRSAKYAIMFIAVTFLTFFLTEVLNKKIVHPIHYALIGIALVLFYSLLLSLSEHMPFNSAYWISGAAIILLVAGYARAVLASSRVALLISAVLTALYGFLFVILQLEDYALLFGSLGLFAILTVVMYLTRRIDWFSVGKTEGAR